MFSILFNMFIESSNLPSLNNDTPFDKFESLFVLTGATLSLVKTSYFFISLMIVIASF